jgi:hypothetical protein
MFQLKRVLYIFVIALMFFGLVGRIVAGSIPIPPQSPFTLGDAQISAHVDPVHAPIDFPAINMAKTGKKQDHHHEQAPRPWYGVLAKDRAGFPLHLVAILPCSAPLSVPEPGLEPSQRPPSC